MKKYAVVVSDYLEVYGASLGVVDIVNTEEEAQTIVENYRNYWTQEGTDWREYEGNLALMLYNPYVEGEYINVEIQEIEV